MQKDGDLQEIWNAEMHVGLDPDLSTQQPLKVTFKQ